MNEQMKKILVVDDEIEICNFVKMFFEKRGFEVYQAIQSGKYYFCLDNIPGQFPDVHQDQ